MRKDLDLFGPPAPLLPEGLLAGREAGVADGDPGPSSEGAPPAFARGAGEGWCTIDGCCEKFASWEAYVQHHRTCHRRGGGSLLCPLCLKWVRKLAGHMTSHQRDWGCDLCSASFVVHGGLREHRAMYHRQLVRPSRQASTSTAPAASQLGWCMFKGCSAVLATWEAYANHCRESHGSRAGGPSLCPTCLEAHPEPPGGHYFQCPRCPARFVEFSRFLNHKSLYHRVKEASQASSLRKPSFIAKIKQYKSKNTVECPKCRVQLRKKRLAQHLKNAHPSSQSK